MNKLRNLAACGLLAVTLAGCGGGATFMGTGLTHPEQIDPPRTSAEMCKAACNHDYAICTDSAGANLPSYGEPRGVIGRGAECNYTLKNCLARCQVLVPQRR